MAHRGSAPVEGVADCVHLWRRAELVLRKLGHADAMIARRPGDGECAQTRLSQSCFIPRAAGSRMLLGGTEEEMQGCLENVEIAGLQKFIEVLRRADEK